ncbi:MAG: carbohydrate ABC transporter permease [Cryobacterium sp.]|nr:carbohydrate ABC transporter permease [Cryobacterium sp.]
MTNTPAPAQMIYRRPRARQVLGRVALYALVIAVSLLTVFPIYWMLVSTVQPSKYSMLFPPPLFPQEIAFDEFANLFANHPIALWLRNSFLIATMVMLLCMALAVPGAYALSRLRWRGRSWFGLFLLVTQMLPEILIIIPLYIIYRRLNMLDSLPALSLVNAAFALPICIWILKGVFDTIPSEVLDAAVVDGCNELSALWAIVLPLSAPGLVAVATVAFFSAWNEFLFAVIMISSAEFLPASVGLNTLKATAFTPVEQYMAAGLIFSILPVFFYLIMQRYIVAGLTAGAVKG